MKKTDKLPTLEEIMRRYLLDRVHASVVLMSLDLGQMWNHSGKIILGTGWEVFRCPVVLLRLGRPSPRSVLMAASSKKDTISSYDQKTLCWFLPFYHYFFSLKLIIPF